ncbi:lysin B [Gordonia phage Kampe]|uniref:Lysin B n=3 Tax=Gordonia phage Orchid TaxID=1838075 RepID=A0A160DHI3_9CAUD|nr:lysin B [Gordonia phage Orchid]ANA87274.1 lysin B [Gordonia phage PatrickStar]ANA87386.1 lysin B [Gordonia phage Orchid]ANA87501.1 lysin B [Gordonia phage Kampe]
MSVTLLKARGIGEPLKNNMLTGLGNRLPKEIKQEEINYPASYGAVPKPGMSFLASLDICAKLTLERIQKAPKGEFFVLAGFSAGAEAMGNFIAAADAEILRRILGIYLVADPSMPRYALNTRKYGIRGERYLPRGVKAKWSADPKDCIPLCSPKPSPLRDIADRSPNMGIGSRLDWLGAYSRINNRAVQGGFGVPDFNAAIQEALGYLVRGDHTGYNVRREPNGKVYLHNGADWIQSLVK